MKEITLHNKIFEVSISDNEIAQIVDSIAKKINATKINDPIFIAVMNGAFLFAADIMRNITIPNAEISFIKLSSYSGTTTTGKVSELIGFSKRYKKSKCYYFRRYH